MLEIEKLFISSGVIAALIGTAGNGKEILFDLLIGKLNPFAGTIKLAGASLAENEPFSRSVGVLSPDDELYKNLSSLENLRLYCQFRGLPRACAIEVLALVGMADQANIKSEKLMMGLLRCVAFGHAILHHIEVVRAANSLKMICGSEQPAVVASDMLLPFDTHQFDLIDASGILDWIVRRFLSPKK